MRLLFVIFLVPISICSSNIPITSELLESVFGNPDSEASPSAISSQVVPVTPSPDGMTDTEYLEAIDKYVPSLADYDKFDWSLTKRVASSSQANFLISPLGLKLALSILTEAATGSTQSELAYVLGFDRDTNSVRQKFAMILSSLQTQSSQYILNLGSRIYVGATVIPQQRFAAISQQFYKTELKSLDFSNPVTAASAINCWVSNATEGRIPDLVKPDDVSGVSALVLNTIFFKGTWQHQFAPNATKSQLFYVSIDDKKETPFMNIRDKFFFTESKRFNAKILRMPYLGNKFAMYVIVPNSLTGLPYIFDGLSELRTELYYLQEYYVDVTIPKFQFEYTSHMDGILKELGVRQAFEDTASFPGLARGQILSNRLKISKVLQRSGVEVNELGSTVYSATEIALENKFGEQMMPNAEVIANRPFLFFIQDEMTRQLLFTGRVSDPSLVDGAFKSRHIFTDVTKNSTKYRNIFLLAGIRSLDCRQNVPSDISRLNFFDTDLLRYTAEDKKGNVMVSPASIKSILAMLLEVTSGDTEAEIKSALRLSPYKDEVRDQLNLYLNALYANASGVTLQNTNAVFVSNRLKLKKEYEQAVRNIYLSSVYTVDFGDTLNAANTINRWINHYTKGLIPALVQPSEINPTSESLLTNALYFKGTWRYAFNPKYTHASCFYNGDSCQKVAMMELHEDMNYAYIDNLRSHALELPYGTGRYSMFVLVPHDRSGINTLIRDLPYMSLPQITLLMESTSVRLFMPKFTIDYSDSVVEPLRKMRINTLFSKNANLSGMFENGSAQVNNFLHKVYLSVDETGTVAAAASSAMVIPLIEDGVQLKVDRPFVFFIRDNELELIIFEGKIEEPSLYAEQNVVDPMQRNGQIPQNTGQWRSG
ncbi:uncharacterized protein LOC125071568 [Vanessa atalanta]|uniref:uncharacterized protein LOC125071568 n=1 Tax=Vanessa atalanta TaxID=42275 RepID=UPI001FCD4B6A|nr:uncharacterized protein LOC125071568 [Vanessa atalanta]